MRRTRGPAFLFNAAARGEAKHEGPELTTPASADRYLGMSRLLAPSLLALALLGAPHRAAAQSFSDAPPPSGAVTTDARQSHWWVSVRADAVSPFFGAWGGTVDVAPCPWLSFGVTPTYVSRDSGTGFAIDATMRIWFLGHGVDGPFLGAVGGLLRTVLDDLATVALDAGGDLGWQIVWNGATVTLSAGAAWMAVLDGPATNIEGPVARLRLELGWSWR